MEKYFKNKIEFKKISLFFLSHFNFLRGISIKKYFVVAGIPWAFNSLLINIYIAIAMGYKKFTFRC